HSVLVAPLSSAARPAWSCASRSAAAIPAACVGLSPVRSTIACTSWSGSMGWLLQLLTRVHYLALFADADDELHCRFLVGYARPIQDQRELALEVGRGVARIGREHLLPGG